MGSFIMQGASFGELMNHLLKERSRFESDDDFKAFALAEVRRFINDLRKLNIELTMRPTYSGTPLSHHSASEKLAEY
jgi:hypothetical protein